MMQSVIRVVALIVFACLVCGCKNFAKDLPAGMQMQVSTTGFRVAPQYLDAPLILGQSTVSVQTPTPEGSGPGLNRNQVKAGFTGIEITSTVASGPVGKEIEAAGGAKALGILLDRPIDLEDE